MSTVEENISTVVGALCAGRVYPDAAPFGVDRPYAEYQQVGGESITIFSREIPSKKNGRFSISSWANTRMEAASLARSIEDAIVSSNLFDAEPIGGPISQYEHDLGLFGMTQDFSIFFDD